MAHLLMRREFFGGAGALPSRKTSRQSLFAIRRSPFTIRHSLWSLTRQDLSTNSKSVSEGTKPAEAG